MSDGYDEAIDKARQLGDLEIPDIAMTDEESLKFSREVRGIANQIEDGTTWLSALGMLLDLISDRATEKHKERLAELAIEAAEAAANAEADEETEE